MSATALTGHEQRIVDVFVGSLVQKPASFDRTIDDDDEMYLYTLEFGVRGNRAWATLAYLHAGNQMMDAVRQIVQWGFGGFGNVSTFMDFACGYGRFMRFLIQEMSVDRLWASDIREDAVAFQVRRFGVYGVVSALDPADYSDDRKYDCIFVASLFSHLHEHAFRSWLRRLYDLLSPHGLLIFSVHDVSLMPANVATGPNGIGFVESNESELLGRSSVLEKDYYGTTYVTESFVANTLADIAGRTSGYCRVPKGLCGTQDLYVVSRSTRDFANLDFPVRLKGHLDTCNVETGGRVSLGGWAVDFGDGSPAPEVQVLVNGETRQRCTTGLSRPDVAEHFHDATKNGSGWACTLPDGSVERDDIVIVRAVGEHEATAIIAFGTLDSLVQ